MIYHGINLSGLEWGIGDPWEGGKCVSPMGCYAADLSDVKLDAIAASGFNLVRLPISWANMEPAAPVNGKRTYNDVYMAAIMDVVARLWQRGIPTLLSLHQWAWSPAFDVPKPDGTPQHGLGMPPWLYTTETIDEARIRFFSDLAGDEAGYIEYAKHVAQAFAGNPALWGIDVFNEPPGMPLFPGGGAEGFESCAELYSVLCTSIRAVNPGVTLVIQDIAWKTDGKDIGLPRWPDLPNCVYSWHLYTDSDHLTYASNLPYLDQHIARAKALGVPFLLGEFACPGPIDAPNWPDFDAFVAYLADNGVNWTYWAYDRCSRPMTQEIVSHLFA